MHGIPFVVKDNFYTDDKHNTSEGGLALLGGRHCEEATIVAKIRAAGGVLLGHASLSEAADHRALTNFSNGYSTRAGQIRNPYNLTQGTSGSSGGSAVAVASNQAAIAFGTETHGSLVHPRRIWDLPGSFYHDTPGPMARSMKDVAYLLDIVAGADRYDNLTWNALGNIPTDGYAARVSQKDGLRGMKLGLPWNPYWSTNAYTPSGRICPVARKLDLPGRRRALRMSTLAQMAAWKDAHNDATGSLGNSTWWYSTEFGQDFYDLAVATNGTQGDDFWTAFSWGRRTAQWAIDGGHAYTTDNGSVIELDALLTPNDDTGTGSQACASIPSYAGYPVAALPVGQTGYAVPFGFCLWGCQWGEAKLVEVASAMEDLFRWRGVPQWHNYETAQGIWDSPWPGYSCSEESLFALLRQTSKTVTQVAQQNPFPIILAGNCSTTVGAQAGLAAARNTVPSCIWFDAHDDFNTPDVLTSGYLDSMPVAMMAGLCWKTLLASVPGFKPLDLQRQLVHCGMRDVTELERSRVMEAGFPVVWGDAEKQVDFEAEVRKVLSEKELCETMVHLDLDALDVSVGKVNKFSAPGGLSEDDLKRCLEMIPNETKPVSLTIALFDPSFDQEGRIRP
ncbi:hypothetical protein LQW54_004303 [Pestalotiopsis sp. IQ-011]